jgi:hypothetical protein
MMRVTLILLAMILLAGCMTADPGQWLLYSELKYLYGRMESKVQQVCRDDPVKLEQFCKDAAAAHDQAKLADQYVRAELSKPRPDWAMISKYADIIISLAGKAL